MISLGSFSPATLDWFTGNAASGRVGLFHDAALLGSIWTSVTVAFWVTVLSVTVGTAEGGSTAADVVVDCAGPASLELFHHALAPVAQLPVLEVVSGVHILSDLTLGLGTVIHDYLA